MVPCRIKANTKESIPVGGPPGPAARQTPQSDARPTTKTEKPPSERCGDTATRSHVMKTVSKSYLAIVVPSLLALTGALQAQEAHKATGGDTCATFTRLWAGEIAGDLRTFSISTPSPEGRYLSGVAWSTGDLAVRDIETGELRRVTHKTASWNQDASFPWTSVFSADGRKLAYMWYVPQKGFEVRLIGIDGSGAHTVFDPPRPCYPRCRLEDWSLDGARLLALIGSEDVSRAVGQQETWQLLLISVDDGSHRVLKPFDHRAPQLVSFSPDGRWVAYVPYIPHQFSRVFINRHSGRRIPSVLL
jgi:hypothetical protein